MVCVNPFFRSGTASDAWFFVIVSSTVTGWSERFSVKCKVEEGQKLFETRTGTLMCCPTAVAPGFATDVPFILHFALFTSHFALNPITRIVTVELVSLPVRRRSRLSPQRVSPAAWDCDRLLLGETSPREPLRR